MVLSANDAAEVIYGYSDYFRGNTIKVKSQKERSVVIRALRAFILNVEYSIETDL